MPPLVGWNNWPDVWQEPTKASDGTPCELSSEPGYIIYSSSGSFWVPLGIIVFVYLSIFYRDALVQSPLHLRYPDAIFLLIFTSITEISFILCSRFGEVSSCCSKTVLPGPDWVLPKCVCAE